ncbi:unnamed protein product [Chondrus crispus]|uniref:Uncharacterized protein n=1 Tax=Chondrus crispus TaxID=2769 RepID=R7Q9R8_CHOCR|nr:unnamed protein product [Chondrus crispus]CDF34136.1 unnamed protein product [Chondrus crispus]|eukprot:XP_005713955.1 unnamed protein product [Chondrus crispus]
MLFLAALLFSLVYASPRLPPHHHAFHAAPATKPLTLSVRSGLTLDACKADTDCFDSRLCYKISATGFDLCRSRDTACFCRPPTFTTCKTLRDCINGEVCAKTDLANPAICVSKEAEKEYSNINEATEFPSGPNRPPRNPRPSHGGAGRRSVSPSPSAMDVVTPSLEPSPDLEAAESPDLSPEPSVAATDEGFPSRSPTPSPGFPLVGQGDPESVCIDANALKHVAPRELIFESHRWARVLCDEYGSCATAGHMVKSEGKAMMMGTFCRYVGCVEKAMMVNSPKYRRGASIRSKTKGLVYTAFAARYQSRVEELIIAAAVRWGL